ncbi:hypothetical protein [Leifsonia sp. Root112D2]|uniref:hypothetical protein n=1 Tax=Leifsonia sp. Root112D2 TaxID=1736426 RepID=UPI0006FF1639|nr:hypothetical protein [Leifsonia sp. Root112D2]KQV06481.1 hypothetical protein ASC63_03345 [Leifsonia sp. Root112D2]
MADKDEKDIDPRYDPAFQRGYQGPAAEDPRRRGAASEPAGPSEQAPAAAVPMTQDPVAREAHSSVPPRSETDLDLDDAGTDACGTEIAAAPLRDGRPPLRTNPYAYALGVMGVLFVIGGIGIEGTTTYSSLSGQNGFSAPGVSSMIMQNVSYVLAGPLITVGLAILAGLVFLAGSRWRSRREQNG